MAFVKGRIGEEWSGRTGLAADHSDDFDRLGGGQFGDRQHQAARRAQPQQRGQRAARARLDDSAIGGAAGPRCGDQRGDAFADDAREIGLDHRLAGGGIVQPLDDHRLEPGIERGTGRRSCGAQMRPTISPPRSARSSSTSRS